LKMQKKNPPVSGGFCVVLISGLQFTHNNLPATELIIVQSIIIKIIIISCKHAVCYKM
jgi:hypothetical protein